MTSVRLPVTSRSTRLGAMAVTIVVVLAAFSPFVVGVADAQETEPVVTEISSCQAITEPGVYRQTVDLSSEGTCISIVPVAGDVVYDGNGYSITGNGTGEGIYSGPLTDDAIIESVEISHFRSGVSIDDSSGTVSNSELTSNEIGIEAVFFGRIDVSDTTFVDNQIGIEYNQESSGTIVRNTFDDNGVALSFLESVPSDVRENTFVGNNIGVLLDAGAFGLSGLDIVDNRFVENGVGLELRSGIGGGLSENTISGNRIVDSTDAGIVFGPTDEFGTIADNEIYNNWLENDVNVRFDSAFSGGENAWSVPTSPGPNIVGGPSIGGNYYATPDGDGFSQTCTDTDEDGFCDTPLSLFANNVDALPLATFPQNEVSSCQAITEPGVYRQTADLSSEGTCISIGGPDPGTVVYDGNGYSITGDGTGVGIDVGPITDEATIENVDISNFRWGIAIFESSGSVSNSELTSNEYGLLTDVDSRADVSDTTFVDNEVGIEYGIDSSGTAVGNTFEDNDVGVSFLDAAPSDVGESTFVANDIGVLIRAGTLGSSGIDVVDSEFVENGVGLELRSLGGIDITENTISGNRIVDSTDVGILVGPSDGFGTIADNEIYDNWLENDVNVRFDSAFDGGVNMWNVPTSGGPNIVGGPSIGGNYYATPAGDGFSQTCTDADGDGFCDTPLSLLANNVDALPLVAPTQISSCQVISTPGQYVQTTDLTATGDCIVVTHDAGEVTYDGNGYSIAGDGAGAGVRIEASASVENVDISEFHQGLYFIGYPGGSVLDSELRGNGVGVYVAELIDVRVSGTVIADNDVGIYYGPSAGGLVDENTIENNGVGVRYDDTFGIGDPVRDNTIVDNGVGVSLSQSDDIEIVSNTFETNGVGVFVSGATLGAGGNDVLDNDFDGNDIAIEFQPMDGGLFRNIVSGNTIVDSTDVGFLVGAPGEFSSFTDNEIYDNRFENHENVRFDPAFDGGANTWNLPANPGPNIVGGPSIGGNYYATPDGDGFSQTCTDADEDGFCDTPNTLFVHNVDELPLVRPAPSEGISFPPGFFVDSDCTGVVTVGSLRVTFEAGFDGGEPTLSMVGFDVGRIDLEELARLIDAVTLTNLELSCTVAPADGGAPTSFDFDLSTYEGRDVAVCFEQADGTVTCFEGPVDEDGWHPDDLDRAVPFARSVFGGNTLTDATFFPDGLPADADRSTADADTAN